MPSTSPSKVPVERNDSRYGTRTEKISCRPSGVPRLNSEKEASYPAEVL